MKKQLATRQMRSAADQGIILVIQGVPYMEAPLWQQREPPGPGSPSKGG